jgi:hypothetical protein
MAQFYLKEGSANAVRPCNQSRQTGEAITLFGLGSDGNVVTFTGIVQSVQTTQETVKEKRFLVTIEEVDKDGMTSTT